MSKSTSLNSLGDMDPNVTNEIDTVLAEIESSKHNNPPPPQQQITMPPMQGQQLPPQQPIQQMQQMPPPPQQLPQMIQQPQTPNPNQNFMPPPYYMQGQQPPQPQSGILDFLQSFLIMGDEFKWVAVIASLFVLMNMNQTVNFVSKYLSFTVNELGSPTILGNVTRGLFLGIVFVLVNKFI